MTSCASPFFALPRKGNTLRRDFDCYDTHACQSRLYMQPTPLLPHRPETRNNKCLWEHWLTTFTTSLHHFYDDETDVLLALGCNGLCMCERKVAFLVDRWASNGKARVTCDGVVFFLLLTHKRDSVQERENAALLVSVSWFLFLLACCDPHYHHRRCTLPCLTSDDKIGFSSPSDFRELR
jgi:hypothetical protein